MSVRTTQRILIQTVGTGGPQNPVWEALTFTIRERRPDVVVWCCWAKTKADTLPKVRRSLMKAEALPEHRELVSAHPHDVQRLFTEYTGLIDELLQEWPDAQLELDYTSGSKPMSAALVLAGVARGFHLLHYAVGRKDENGFTVATDRLMSLSPGTAVIDRQLRQLGELFNLGQFDAVHKQAQSLRSRVQEPTQFQRATSLTILAEAYSRWDRFHWSHAQNILRRVDRNEAVEAAGWNIAILKQQAEHIRACDQSWNSPQRLADLLANADRCIARGRFDDAVARLYRLTECIGQVRFAERFGVTQENGNPTSNVALGMLRQHAPELAVELKQRGAGEDGHVNLGLYYTIQALFETGDLVGQAMKEKYGPLDDPRNKGPLGQQLEQRNNSLLAHGSSPIRDSVATELRATVADLLEKHFQAEGISLADLMTSAHFVTCPWAPST